MKTKLATLAVAALAMYGLKRHYADAPVSDLRWILDPTTRLVAAATGATFEWQPGEGYLSRERFFLIAKVCAGVNFMIAAFGMTVWSLRRRISDDVSAAGVLVVSALASYAAAVVVNAARITVAMWLAAHPSRGAWLTEAQLHRVEGIVFFFGALVLLSEAVSRVAGGALVHSPTTRPAPPETIDPRFAVPLICYYAIAVAVPLANGAAGAAFIEHALFVLVLPLALIAVASAGRECLYALRGRG